MKSLFRQCMNYLSHPDGVGHLAIAIVGIVFALFPGAITFFWLNLTAGYESNWMGWYMLLWPVIWVLRIALGLYAAFCAVRFGALFWRGKGARYGLFVGVLAVLAELGFFVVWNYGFTVTHVADEVGLYLHIRNHIDLMEIERRIEADPQALRDEIAATRATDEYCPPLRLGYLRFSRCRVKLGDGYILIWYSHSFDLSSHGILIVTEENEISEIYSGRKGAFRLSPHVYYWISLSEYEWTVKMSRILRRLGLFPDEPTPVGAPMEAETG